MFASDCLIKEVKVSTRMIYKKDWCGDQLDHYTDAALVSLDVLLVNRGKVPVKSDLRAVITSCDDLQEKTVGTREIILSPGEHRYKLAVTVKNVRLWGTWDMGVPALYCLKLEYADAVWQRQTGMKETAYDSKTGVFTLNRERIFLRGVEAQKQGTDPAALKALGVNALYVSKDVCSEELLAQCDEQGLLVIGACPVTEADLTPEKINELAQEACAFAAAAAGHVSLGALALDADLPVYQKADPENARMAYCNVLFETLAGTDPARPVLFPGRGERRAAAVFSGEELIRLDPRSLKLPPVVTHIGLPETAAEGSDFAGWEAEYLRIRKYDPVSAVFLREEGPARDGVFSPVLAAFEPGYFPGENGRTVSIEAGKTFTARIWAVNDLHERIPDVKLSWRITDTETGQVRAGNSFRLNLNPDSAEIPDQPILVTQKEDSGRKFCLSVCFETDEEVLSKNDLIVSVL